MTRDASDRARLTADARRKMAAEDAVGCETLIARQPDYVELRNDAANLYLELGQPRDALRHFEVVARLQPTSAPARYNVGVALEAAGRPGDAAPQYRGGAAPRSGLLARTQQSRHAASGGRAGRRGPARVPSRRRIGAAQRRSAQQPGRGAPRLDNAAAAIPQLTRAIELRPTYPEAHFNLARAYASTRQFEAAIRAASDRADAGERCRQDRPAREHSRTAADLSRRGEAMTGGSGVYGGHGLEQRNGAAEKRTESRAARDRPAKRVEQRRSATETQRTAIRVVLRFRRASSLRAGPATPARCRAPLSVPLFLCVIPFPPSPSFPAVARARSPGRPSA